MPQQQFEGTNLMADEFQSQGRTLYGSVCIAPWVPGLTADQCRRIATIVTEGRAPEAAAERAQIVGMIEEILAADLMARADTVDLLALFSMKEARRLADLASAHHRLLPAYRAAYDYLQTLKHKPGGQQ